MKQLYRFNTFETNSSSTHTLILVNPEIFEEFKKGSRFYNVDAMEFWKFEDVNKMSDFQYEYPDHENQTLEEQEDNIEVFKQDYMDTDYAPGYTCDYLDYCYTNVIDKETAEDKVAVSIYIGG